MRRTPGVVHTDHLPLNDCQIGQGCPMTARWPKTVARLGCLWPFQRLLRLDRVKAAGIPPGSSTSPAERFVDGPEAALGSEIDPGATSAWCAPAKGAAGIAAEIEQLDLGS